MSATVTLKLTPLEFDLLREALDDCLALLKEEEENIMDEKIRGHLCLYAPDEASQRGLLTLRGKILQVAALKRKLI
jgi:hypothetical protein